MSLKDKIIQDLTSAMKARDELKMSTLRMLKAGIMNQEVSGNTKVEATDEVVMEVIRRSIKQRREAAEGFTKGGNMAMAQKERDEMKILESYLPAQMSEAEVKKGVEETIAELKASKTDFGKVMGAVMGKLKGKADGAMVGKVVREMLK